MTEVLAQIAEEISATLGSDPQLRQQEPLPPLGHEEKGQLLFQRERREEAQEQIIARLQAGGCGQSRHMICSAGSSILECAPCRLSVVHFRCVTAQQRHAQWFVKTLFARPRAPQHLRQTPFCCSLPLLVGCCHQWPVQNQSNPPPGSSTRRLPADIELHWQQSATKPGAWRVRWRSFWTSGTLFPE